MSFQSVQVLGDTQVELNVTSDKVRADGWYGQKDGLHTISFYLDDFTGRIYLEASLATDPEESDWFDIFLNGGNSYQEYPLTPGAPTGTHGDTLVDAYTFQINALWVRVKIDRSYVMPQPTTDAEKTLLGSVSKILLNH